MNISRLMYFSKSRDDDNHPKRSKRFAITNRGERLLQASYPGVVDGTDG